MNKELEAIKRLEAIIEDEWLGIDTWLKNELPFIKQALKRNEPMKVDLETILSIRNSFFYNCPKCGKPLRRYYNYCPDCGQKLDWSNWSRLYP